MRAGWNETRRNRNQGTAKRGRGQNNRMVIPCSSRTERRFYEQLRDAIIVTRGIPTPLDLYIEPPRGDCRHACSIDDIVHILRKLPVDHVSTIGHHVDYLEHQRRTGSSPEEAAKSLSARPRSQRETAAHRYADEWGDRLRAAGVIPFPLRIREDLRAEGIDPAWFGRPTLDAR